VATRRLACALAITCITACAGSEKKYGSFADVPYDYPNQRTLWSARAGLRVHVAELNPTAKETLVLIHPWSTNMMIWHDVAPKLANDRRVLLIDLPGHGKSSKPYGEYPVRRLAFAVLDILDALKIEMPVVVGNSLGGATSIEVAHLAPKRIQGIILIGSPGGQEINSALRTLTKGATRPRNLNTLTDTSYYLGFLVVTRRMSPLAERLYADLVALRESNEFPQYARSTSSALAEVITYAPELEKIETRALVLQGTQDLVVPLEHGEAIARRLQHAQFSALGGCGHLPQLECPDLLVSHIVAWLDQDQAPSSAMSTSLKPSK
jgi:pimeloyl-ACP methyl ester carboxylesterase